MLCVCVRACACASAGHSVLILCVVFELCISVLVQCEGCCFPSAPPSLFIGIGLLTLYACACDVCTTDPNRRCPSLTGDARPVGFVPDALNR